MSENHHIIPLKYLVGTFVSLLILTFITVYITRFDFGSLNLIIAMLVAGVKAMLVVQIFMALKWEKGFNPVAFFGSLVFVLIFIILTFSDLAFRKHRDQLESGVIEYNSPVTEIGSHHHNHDDHDSHDKKSH